MSDKIRIPKHEKAQHFLSIADQFKLGDLPTEQSHPDTKELAKLSREDLPSALKILKAIDINLIKSIAQKLPDLTRLQSEIYATLASGDNVFLYGCGATGRLSLSLEYIWRILHRDDPDKVNRVTGFMSGGDLALVHSIENFEDHPEFGAKQVQDIGFGPNDLLISCTEGGETPSVIGATEEAARISSRKPFFLYCNPNAILRSKVQRSKHVLDNKNIEKICLFTGPMALSGSTRLQASTALMLGVGWALYGHEEKHLTQLSNTLQNTDFSFLKEFIKEESRIYQDNEYVLYETDIYGITILTDTTERAPTFSLRGFENQNDENRTPSLAYLILPHAQNVQNAWEQILARKPVPIEWPDLKNIAGQERLYGFDFSKNAKEQRHKIIPPDKQHLFRIWREGDTMHFALGTLEHRIKIGDLSPLYEHVLLKVILNIHSTLVMGRIGRFESNIMTWVKPSNYKLIDRSIRYVQYLLLNDGVDSYSYDDICHVLFTQYDTLGADAPIVLKTYENLVQDLV